MSEFPPEHAQQLLQLSPQPVLLVDLAGRVQGYNDAFRALVGDLVIDGSTQPDTGLLQPLLGTGTVINWSMPDGEQRWLVVDVVELTDAAGVQARFYRDVTETLRLRHERDALQEELQRQSLYDADIPNILNHNGLLLTVAPLVARARRYATPLSALVLSVADSDHHARDLRTVASILRDQTRWADLLGMNDARAFVLVLQETTAETALLLVDKLYACFAQHGNATGEALTVRYGLAECCKTDDAEALLARAGSQLLGAPGSPDDGVASPAN